eukprot:629497_1
MSILSPIPRPFRVRPSVCMPEEVQYSAMIIAVRPTEYEKPVVVPQTNCGTHFHGDNTLDRFLAAIRHIASELEAEKAALKIVDETCKLVDAARATMFFVDDSTDELVLLVAKGSDSIRIPLGSGIVGHVAVTGRTINVADAYTDDRFDATTDTQTSFETKSVLATPVRDYDGEIVAVLQAVNKRNGQVFSTIDETLIENLASHVGVSLRNAQYYQQAVTSKRQVSSLIFIIKLLHSEPNIQSLIYTLTQHTPDLLVAEYCVVFVVDRSRKQLNMMRSDGSTLRRPISNGIAGYVATSGALVNIPDACADTRFDPESDQRLGHVTGSVLAMPIKNREGVVIGVLEAFNKANDDFFQEEDEQMLETLLGIAGEILSKDPIFRAKDRPSEIGVAADLTVPKSGRHHLKTLSSTSSHSHVLE